MYFRDITLFLIQNLNSREFLPYSLTKIFQIIYQKYPAKSPKIGTVSNFNPLHTVILETHKAFPPHCPVDCETQGEGTQPPSLLSPPGAGSLRLCNAMEAESCPTPHPSPPAS